MHASEKEAAFFIGKYNSPPPEVLGAAAGPRGMGGGDLGDDLGHAVSSLFQRPSRKIIPGTNFLRVRRSQKRIETLKITSTRLIWKKNCVFVFGKCFAQHFMWPRDIFFRTRRCLNGRRADGPRYDFLKNVSGHSFFSSGRIGSLFLFVFQLRFQYKLDRSPVFVLKNRPIMNYPRSPVHWLGGSPSGQVNWIPAKGWQPSVFVRVLRRPNWVPPGILFFN